MNCSKRSFANRVMDTKRANFPRYPATKSKLAHYLTSTASGVLLSGVSSIAMALGLGEISSDSYLGQPLNARVGLVNDGGNLDPDSLVVRPVAGAEASAIGADVFYGRHQLDVQIVEEGGNYFVTLATDAPVKEPYLSVLLELRWPTGVVYRAYPILLDPPPAIRPPSQTRAQARPAEEDASTARSTPPRASAPAAQRATLRPLDTEQGEYKVAPGDNLSTISARWVEGTSQGIAQTNEWLLENNPQAFINGNIDRLKAGVVLRMPDLSALGAETDTSTAQQRSTAPTTLDMSSQSLSDPDSATAVTEEPPAQSDAISAEIQGLMTVSDNTDDRTRELIDMLARENANLRSRMQKVESSEYLTTMRELVELQQQQIQELQAKLGEQAPEAQALESMYEAVEMEPVTPGALNETDRLDDSEALTKQEVIREVDNNAANIEVEETNEHALVEVEPQGVESLVDDSNENRTRLITLLVIAGGILFAILTAMLLYYRKMTRSNAEPMDDLPPMDSLRTEPTYTLPATTRSMSGRDDEAFDADDSLNSDLQGPSELDEQDGEAWDDESVDLEAHNRELDDVFDDLQDEFSDLELDDNFLNDARVDLSDETLDGFTSDLGDDDPHNSASEPEETPEPAKPKVRRSDAEVKNSIAEKMSQYRAEDRTPDEILSAVEFEDFDGTGENGPYDELETTVYRALMYCEFKKFDKARHLIEVKMETDDDPRLAEALEQVETLEIEAHKKNAG